MSEKREQVAKQCEAVSHLATAIAKVHADMAMLFRKHDDDSLVETVGRDTADLMETLGDILNGMDAVSEDDHWLDPVFEEAHRLWPQRKAASHE